MINYISNGIERICRRMSMEYGVSEEKERADRQIEGRAFQCLNGDVCKLWIAKWKLREIRDVNLK